MDFVSIKSYKILYKLSRNIKFNATSCNPKKASQWANPFAVKIYGRDKCLELYEEHIRNKIKKEGIEDLKKLKNKVLGCWCKPEKCHGDILLKILNEIED